MLIKPGFGISAMSGKLGGTVYARNRGGLYARSLAVPLQPDSPAQTEKWQIWQNSADAFASLNAEQLERWNTYAEQVTASNRLGDPIKLTAQQIFTELYTNASLVGDTPLVVPPACTNRPTVQSVFGLIVTASGGQVERFRINHLDAVDTSEAGVWVLISAAAIQRPTVRNVNNQFRIITTRTAPSGTMDIFDDYISRFDKLAEPGQLAHVKIRPIANACYLGGPAIKLTHTVTG
jgi:hypothetical protein